VIKNVDLGSSPFHLGNMTYNLVIGIKPLQTNRK